jgi:methionyl aminopeptidase
MAKKKTTSKKTTPKSNSTTKKATTAKKTTKKKTTSSKTTTRKTTTKKTTSKKKTSSKKKTTAKKTSAKKVTTKKPTTKKTTTKKTTTKKKTTPKKTAVKRTTTKKTTTKKTPEQVQQEKERLEAYKKAGEISKKIKEFIKPLIKPGAKLLDLVEKAEKKIVELGGRPGFPVNISLNHVAAHFTPPPGDNTIIQEGDIVKFDHGVHIEGYCVDTAFTVNLSTDPGLKNLVKASEEAVSNAIKIIKHGAMTNSLGSIIEETVRKYGYKPIMNLDGHKIDRWDLHAGKSIPCISQPSGDKMEEGEVFAVEVFTSTGKGRVHAQESNAQIFQIIPTRNAPLRSKHSKKVLGYVAHQFQTLPFSRYQVFKEFGIQGIFGLKMIVDKTNQLEEHKILAEKKGFYVAQTEHTVLVTKTGCKILT